MIQLEFKEKQFDGPYEISEVQINNEDKIFRGLLYFPPKPFKKPFPLIIYFHGFPQIFTLKEIVKRFRFILDMGYSFLIFNYRGYRYSEGEVSIKSQVSDSIKVLDFIEKMARKNIFILDNINLIAHDFGSYIALILCSKTKLVNKLLLLTPILNLKRLVYSNEFIKVLHYINRFLPGNVRGIDDVNAFINKTKKEIKQKKFQIETVISRLRNKEFKIITGEKDKVTPISEVNEIIKRSNLRSEIVFIKDMDHEIADESEIDEVNEEIRRFFEFI